MELGDALPVQAVQARPRCVPHHPFCSLARELGSSSIVTEVGPKPAGHREDVPELPRIFEERGQLETPLDEWDDLAVQPELDASATGAVEGRRSEVGSA